MLFFLYIRTYLSIYQCFPLFLYLCMPLYTLTNTHTHTHTHKYIYTYIYIYELTYAGVRVRMNSPVCVVRQVTVKSDDKSQ